MITFKRLSSQALDELRYDGEYGEYIMEHCHGERIICNGDTLLNAMESDYLWDDFLDSKGIDPVPYDEEIYSPYYGA